MLFGAFYNWCTNVKTFTQLTLLKLIVLFVVFNVTVVANTAECLIVESLQNNQPEVTWKVAVSVEFEVLSRHWPGRTEENYEKTQSE
jgi:hypothetical protein